MEKRYQKKTYLKMKAFLSYNSVFFGVSDPIPDCGGVATLSETENPSNFGDFNY